MVGVEEDAAVGSKGGDLAELKQQNTSLFSLIGILLSPRTFPHLVTIVVFTVLLNLLARNGSTSLSAMGFLSLSAGYFVTGLLSGNERVRSFTQLQPKEEASELHLWKRMVFSFRICLLPLTFSVICFASLASLGDGNETLPLLLSSCFVVWAVVQGRSFGSFLSSLSARKLPPASPRTNVTNPFSVGMSYLCVLLLSVVLVIAFEFLASSNGDWASWLVDNVLFFFMLTGLYILTWRRTRDVRQQASGQADHHAYATRWLLLSQLLITWHLLTVWRHWTISPGGPLLFVEELVLMVFTVLMAIWGLTSRTFRSPLKLVTLDNALPIGLAFGYAYAGSVAMLTVVLEDVQTVMMAGHMVVMLTFMWMQPRVLNRVLRGMTEASEIKAMVEKISPAASPHREGSQERNQGDTNQQHEEVANPDPSIGAEIQWSEPKVLANEVAWDDEVELLD